MCGYEKRGNFDLGFARGWNLVFCLIGQGKVLVQETCTMAHGYGFVLINAKDFSNIIAVGFKIRYQSQFKEALSRK